MSSQADSASNGASRSSILTTGVIILCLSLIIGAGFVKTRLDAAQSMLAAPDQAFTQEQDVYARTIGTLGYGGFLGSAQLYVSKQDHTALNDMRMSLKTASDYILRATDKSSSADRKDVRGILDLYANLLSRAEGADGALTTADLSLAANALNVLDARLQSAAAQNRLSAQDAHKMWSLFLTLLAIGGFVLAASLALWVRTVQNRNLLGPIQSLRQSVMNMVHGDLQHAIWGMERADDIGALARAIDNARLYFGQLPDLSIIDENGTARVKFEGESRSLFKNMMANVAQNFEKSQQTVFGFTGMMSAHQETMAKLTRELGTLMTAMVQQGSANEAAVKSLTTTLGEASQSLSQTQEAGVRQINKIVPFMQERMKNMAEVTQLAGTQMTQSLQSLIKTEGTLRSAASQSQQTVQQLAQSTAQMGERMFAALSLMQASSKQLGDTTAAVKDRFQTAVESLGTGEQKLHQVIEKTELRLASTLGAEESMETIVARTEASASKMEKAVNTIFDRHEALNEQVVTATHRMDAIVASFDAAQRAMNDAATQIRRDGAMVGNLLTELRANNDQLLSSLSQNSQTSFSAVQGLAEKSHALMQRLEVQIQQQAHAADARIDELSSHSQTMAQQATNTTSTLAQAVTSLKGEQEKLVTTRTRFTEMLESISRRLEDHATTTFGKTEQWASQSFVKLTTMAEQMESVMSRLNILGQLTGTLGSVAGQLGQIVPALTQYGASLPAQTAAPMTAVAGEAAPVIIDMEGTKQLIVQQTESILGQLQEEWHKAVNQIEAMHDQLAQIVIQQKDQLETRLVVMDKKLRDTADLAEETSELAEAEERQAAVINELVSAISKINEHVIEIDETIEQAGLKKEA